MEGTGFGAPNLCWDVLHFNMAHCRACILEVLMANGMRVRCATPEGVRTRPIPTSFGKFLPKSAVFGDWRRVERWNAPDLGPRTYVGTFFTSIWHIVGAL